jgi:hypothetical protein
MSLLLLLNSDVGSFAVTWDRDDTTVVQMDETLATHVQVRVEENP